MQKTVVTAVKLKLKKDEVKKQAKERTQELVDGMKKGSENKAADPTKEARDSISRAQNNLKPLINDLKSNYMKAIREIEVKMARSPFPPLRTHL